MIYAICQVEGCGSFPIADSPWCEKHMTSGIKERYLGNNEVPKFKHIWSRSHDKKLSLHSEIIGGNSGTCTIFGEPRNAHERKEQEAIHEIHLTQPHKEISRPPVGLRPQWLAREARIEEIINAMANYSDAQKPTPIEWLNELRILFLQMKGD